MLRLSHLLMSLFALTVGFALELAALHYWDLTALSAPPGPESMQEVIRIADGLGLYWRSDRFDGLVSHRLVVSERPVSCVRANDMRFGAPEHRCWNRTVAVCYPAKGHVMNFDPVCSAVWGQMMLYGDPEVIHKLTGQ